MGMYLIEAGTWVRFERKGSIRRFRYKTKKTLVYDKSEVKWRSKWRMAFQHHESYKSGHPDFTVICPIKDVKYG